MSLRRFPRLYGSGLFLAYKYMAGETVLDRRQEASDGFGSDAIQALMMTPQFDSMHSVVLPLLSVA